MKMRMTVLMLAALFLVGCQGAKLAQDMNISAPAPAKNLSAESCRSMMETYIREIEAHPDKYTEENLAQYPVMMQYGLDMAQCQEKGFLTPQEMMETARKISMEINGHTEPDIEETVDAQ